MPTPRVLMSKIRQALQLLADSGLSMRQVAAALGVIKTTVSEIAMYARDAQVDWPKVLGAVADAPDAGSGSAARTTRDTG